MEFKIFMFSNSLNRRKNLENLVQEFCLLFAIFLFFLVAFAILGIFYQWLIILTFILFLGIGAWKIYYLYSFRKVKISRFQKWLLVFLIAVTLFNAFYHHDLPQSRDNIAYLTAGVMLAKNHQLYFQDILSRPFHPYREISLGQDIFTSQFLPGYNAFLGFWYHLGGLNLVFWGNLILFFLFLLCFYGVAANLASRKIALLALLFLVTFYSFLWFPRRTNSENLVMFLLWLSLWLFIKGVKMGDLKRSFLGFLPASLLILVRGEGLLYLFVFIIACFSLVIKQRKELKKHKRFLLPLLWLPLIFFLWWRYKNLCGGVYIFEHGLSLFYTITDFLKVPFVMVILILGLAVFYLFYLLIKYLLKKSKPKVSSHLQFIAAFLFTLFIFLDLLVIYYHHHFKELGNWQIYRTQYVFIILGKYFLFPYFIFFVLGLLGPRLLSRQFYYCVFLLSPSFIFFLDPFVGLDQPWFLRRFYPTIIPFLFILGAFGLANLGLKRKHLFLFSSLLLLMNLWVSYPIIFFREYQGMQKQLRDFSSRFEKDSLVLMDPGWQWQQWAYALHYIYGRNVLPKLDGFPKEEFQKLLVSYNKVYIVSTQRKNVFDHPDIPDDKLNYLFETQISYPTIIETCKITEHVVENEDQVQMRKILNEYRSVLPRQRDIEAYNLYIYEYEK